MSNIATIIQKLGGPAAVGRRIGVSTEHATQMKRRNSVPVRYWPLLIDLAKDSKLPLSEADLVHMRNSADVRSSPRPKKRAGS